MTADRKVSNSSGEPSLSCDVISSKPVLNWTHREWVNRVRAYINQTGHEPLAISTWAHTSGNTPNTFGHCTRKRHELFAKWPSKVLLKRESNGNPCHHIHRLWEHKASGVTLTISTEHTHTYRRGNVRYLSMFSPTFRQIVLNVATLPVKFTAAKSGDRITLSLNWPGLEGRKLMTPEWINLFQLKLVTLKPRAIHFTWRETCFLQDLINDPIGQ